MIRSLDSKDLEELKLIHRLHFSHEFPFPDFMNYLCSFVVEDEKGIVMAGGIRDIAELVAVTNLSRHPVDRMKAIYQILDASSFVSSKMGYDQMYAWSQNSKWTTRMLKLGFRPSDGQSLIIDLRG